jgi:flagellar capping protein FliD
MTRMGISDQIKAAIQDLVAPALHEIRGDVQVIRGEMQGVRAEIQGVRVDIRRLDEKIDNVDARLTTRLDSLQAQMGSMKNELISEIRRVDVRIDGVDRELRVAIDIRERLAALEARRA